MKPYFSSDRFFLIRSGIAFLICGVIIVDLLAQFPNKPMSEAKPVSQLKADGLPADYSTRVAFVRSDDPVLSQPVGLDQELSDEQVHEMVFRALDQSGDLKPLLFDGAKITLKPNIVIVTEQKGCTTDPRVVEGIILWIEKQGYSNIKYTVAECGAAWLMPAMKDTAFNAGQAKIADGFEVMGYREIVRRLESCGISVELVDANFGSYEKPLSRIREVPVPAFIDFPEFDSYWIHECFLDADLLINVPVMKTHIVAYVTLCLKNHIGLPAGAKYGFTRKQGGPNAGDPHLHRDFPEKNSVEQEIVDLAAIGRPQYNVVDALVGMERFHIPGGAAIRRNMIVAGPDMVAVDSVCMKLMGLNPSDAAHVMNAAREGLGTMDDAQIEIVSERGVEESMFYFEHSVEDQTNRPRYGTTPRVWLLNSSAGDDLGISYLEKSDKDIVAEAGKNGWTEPLYFSDEYIDFAVNYSLKNGHCYYAFCWIDVPREEEAELWFSANDDGAMWIGGEKVYETQGVNTPKCVLPGRASAVIQLKKGRHPLLVKLVHTAGLAKANAAFAFNICRIVPRPLPKDRATFWDTRDDTNHARYAGSRVSGLKFDCHEKNKEK
ncbi:MAG: DUF362 domain-containing protein [Candidatus Omnitrophota bacterium]|jgi:uncharacterized protein (DUF362 family)|nr:MAG: DUF362 domain-containing protein [Candidatus Omnitrophota bacterium]